MNINDNSDSPLVVKKHLYHTDRAIAEIRRGMPVLIQTDTCNRLMIASETLKFELENVIRLSSLTILIDATD